MSSQQTPSGQTIAQPSQIPTQQPQRQQQQQAQGSAGYTASQPINIPSQQQQTPFWQMHYNAWPQNTVPMQQPVFWPQYLQQAHGAAPPQGWYGGFYTGAPN